MNTIKILTAAAALVATVSSAQAEIHYSRSGDWDIGMGTSSAGRPMCAIGIHATDKSVWLESFSGYAGVYFQVAKADWQIPAGQRLNISLQVDNAPPMVLTGEGYAPANGKWSGFQVPIATTDVWSVTGKPMIEEVSSLLSTGREMRITFLNGTETPWVAPLNGSTQALKTMISCMNLIAETTKPAAPTQPFSSAAPQATQPFVTVPSHSL